MEEAQPEPQEQASLGVSEAPSLIRKLFNAHRATTLRPRPNAKGWCPTGKALTALGVPNCTNVLAYAVRGGCAMHTTTQR